MKRALAAVVVVLALIAGIAYWGSDRGQTGVGAGSDPLAESATPLAESATGSAAQRVEGVEAGGAASGDEAGDRRHEQQRRGDDSECWCVERLDAEQKRGQVADRHGCGAEADRQT